MRKLVVLLTIITLIFAAAQNSTSRFGIEVPLGIVSTRIDLPRLMTDLIQKVESGTGYDIGIGITYQNAGYFNWRGGFHAWSVPFKPTINMPPHQKNDYVVEDRLLK